MYKLQLNCESIKKNWALLGAVRLYQSFYYALSWLCICLYKLSLEASVYGKLSFTSLILSSKSTLGDFIPPISIHYTLSKNSSWSWSNLKIFMFAIVEAFILCLRVEGATKPLILCYIKLTFWKLIWRIYRVPPVNIVRLSLERMSICSVNGLQF